MPSSARTKNRTIHPPDWRLFRERRASPVGTRAQEERVDAFSPAPALVPRQRRTTQNVRHVAVAWPGGIARVRHADHRLLLLDFDGTLVGLRRHPDDVRFSERGKKILRQLVGHENLTVAVVSGRELDKIPTLV